MAKYIGVLTSGGDCPGLNAAIRGLGKAAQDSLGMSLVGFRDGFRGLVFDKTESFESADLSGIISLGAGIAGGADVILIPEIPYDLGKVADSINRRTRKGKRFSIVAVAEGSMRLQDSEKIEKLLKKKEKSESAAEKTRIGTACAEFIKKGCFGVMAAVKGESIFSRSFHGRHSCRPSVGTKKSNPKSCSSKCEFSA